MDIQKLKEKYETACNEYLKVFCEKHNYEYDPDGWVAGDIGSVICINADYFISMDVIRIDIDMNVPKPEFAKWYEYNMRTSALGLAYTNYMSWIRGLRKYSEVNLQELEASQKRLEDLKKEFEEKIKQTVENAKCSNS